MLFEQCDKNYAMLQEKGEILGYCAASGCSSLWTFRFNISYHPQGSRIQKKIYLNLEDGIGISSETSVRNYYY